MVGCGTHRRGSAHRSLLQGRPPNRLLTADMITLTLRAMVRLALEPALEAWASTAGCLAADCRATIGAAAIGDALCSCRLPLQQGQPLPWAAVALRLVASMAVGIAAPKRPRRQIVQTDPNECICLESSRGQRPATTTGGSACGATADASSNSAPEVSC